MFASDLFSNNHNGNYCLHFCCIFILNKSNKNYQSHVLSTNYFPGNEARHVTMKDDTGVNRASAAAVPSVSYIYTSILGVSISFVGKCTEPFSL